MYSNPQNNACPGPGPSSQPYHERSIAARRPIPSHQALHPRQYLTSSEIRPDLPFEALGGDDDDDGCGEGEGYSDQDGDAEADQEGSVGVAGSAGRNGRGGGNGPTGDASGQGQPQKKRRIGGGPGSRGGGANEGKGGSGIVRVNRACTNCRRMKMRCVGAESPPCKRCSHTGQKCVMVKPNKPGPVPGGDSSGGTDMSGMYAGGVGSGGMRIKDESGNWDGGGEGERFTRSPDGDDRIRYLENQVSSMQNTLLDLVSTIKVSSGLNHHSGSSSSVYEHISPASVHSLSGYGNTGWAAGNNPNPTIVPSSAQIPQGPDFGPSLLGMAGHQQLPDESSGNQNMIRESPINPPEVNPAMVLARNRLPSGSLPRMDFPPGLNLRHASSQQPYTTTDPAYNELSAASNDFMEQALNLGPSPAASIAISTSGRAQSVTVLTDSAQSATETWFGRGSSQGPLQPARGVSVDMGALSRTAHGGSAMFPTGGLVPGPSPISAKQSHLRGTPAASGDNSPALSNNEDEDPLGPTSIMAPLSSMAGLAEAAAAMGRLDANSKGKQALRVGPDTRGAAVTAGTSGRQPEDDAERASKKRKPAEGLPAKVSFATPAIPEYTLLGPKKDKVQIGNSPVVELPVITEFVRTSRGKEVRRHVHAFPDVIALELVSEEEARSLFKLFFEGCHAFIPVFDLERDTWDSLRDRSPFLITSIVAIGARVRDGGGPISETQRLSLDHARKIAISTLFAAVHRVEAIQAMILISAFNDAGWVPANYTGLLAIDMGLNKCFIKLLQTGMGIHKNGVDIEDDRDLVIGSRAWLCLYMIEHQMAFGTGRPALLREDECITKCRQLLQHPLAIPSDVRLVSTVELMALRAPLHVVLTNSPDQPVDQATVLRLQEANADFDRWQAHWDRILSERFSIDRSDFYRESLAIQREYSSLFINSQLLRGVKEAADVKRMPQDKRELAMRAMRNAQACLEIALRGRNYRQALKFAVHYTHVCAAFAASFLVRIARLFPKELNLRKTAKDVEELAAVLADTPAGRYSRSLRLILRRARKQKVMPPPTAPSSPRLHGIPAPLQLPPSSQSSNSAHLDQHVAALLTSAGPTSNSNNAPSIPQRSPAFSHASPGSLLAQMGKNPPQDSPSSNPEAWQQYDFAFAQELWNNSGVRDGADDQLPLYLNGESLGNVDSLNPAFGLENFFVPPEVDLKLGDLGAFPDTLQGMSWTN